MLFEQAWMIVVHWLHAFYSSYLFLVVSILLFVSALTQFIKKIRRLVFSLEQAVCACERRDDAILRKGRQKREF